MLGKRMRKQESERTWNRMSYRQSGSMPLPTKINDMKRPSTLPLLVHRHSTLLMQVLSGPRRDRAWPAEYVKRLPIHTQRQHTHTRTRTRMIAFPTHCEESVGQIDARKITARDQSHSSIYGVQPSANQPKETQ